MKKLTKKNRIYKSPTPVIGLTGGIATGKTTVANIFTDLGFTVICADSLIKNLYKKAETITFIQSNYPLMIKDDEIDFPALRELFFKNEDVKEKVENYLYSKIANEFHKHLPSKAKLVIYDAPVLFEKGLDKLVEATICVYTTKEIQIKRVIKRDHISEISAGKILKAQLPIDDKKNMADYVVDNSGSIDETKDQVQKLVSLLNI